MKKMSISVRLILWAFLFCPLIVSGQTARRVAETTFPSVVLLVMEDSNGQTVSLGSGFFVSSNVVATNLHVIESATRGYAKLVGQRTKFDIVGIVGIDSSRDLALLMLEGAKAPFLSVSANGTVAVGDDVYVVGNPQGLEGTLSQGIISSLRRIGNDTLMQITAPISPGSSGGPVLNSEGKVIGVAVATLKGGQNLNFAIPSSYLSPLISNMRLPQRLSTGSATSGRSSLSNDLGGKLSAGVTGGQWAWTYSGLEIGSYSFTLRNELREPVKNVKCLVVFLDKERKPLDVDIITVSGVIPGGLARRISSKVDGSVQRLAQFAQFRILDFEVVE